MITSMLKSSKSDLCLDAMFTVPKSFKILQATLSYFLL